MLFFLLGSYVIIFQDASCQVLPGVTFVVTDVRRLRRPSRSICHGEPFHVKLCVCRSLMGLNKPNPLTVYIIYNIIYS